MGLINPYASFIDSLEKPARYIGGEHFITTKDWSTVDSKVALCFPDAYEIGMSHLGMKILYEELNKVSTIAAERCFCPWIDMEKELRERDLPLVSLENFKPLNEFDIVGFSLQYEMSYTNILNMLDLGRIPLWQKDRSDSDPFVIAGGPCGTHPEPIAPFMDFVVIGDGEKIFVRIAHFIGEARLQGYSRKQILMELAQWDGIYVPSFYDTEIDERSGLECVSDVKEEYKDKNIPTRIKRFHIESLVNYPFPTKSPIPHMTAIFDRFSVELSRGCTEGCRFCQAGMIYRPVRERNPKEVIETVVAGLENGGFDEASLTCLSTADYSAVTPLILELLDKLVERNATMGISSLRAYGLDNRIFDKLAEVRNTSLTFAPEGGSERIRKVINKNISDEDMFQTARDIFSRGWKKMKLYFMIGLPTEEDEDVVAIMETAKKAKNVGKFECGVKGIEVTVSASSFVPKPHTPFQWAPMITHDEIVRKQNLLKDYAVKYKLLFKKHYSKISHLEGIVSRGDRRIAQVIYNAWSKGCRFDGWDETFDYDTWVQCVKDSGINTEYMLGSIPVGARLPWDHIDVGLKDKFLEREWKLATKNRLAPPCGKVKGMMIHHTNLEALEKTFKIDKKRLVCYDCGIECDLKGMVDERSDFLKSMDAIDDIPYVEPEILKKDIQQLREKRNENELGVKYRIEFAKIGSISFISHLDTLKIIARIFKRANIEMLYSEGYKKRPLISFGPALALGVSSLSEFLDVRVPHAWENDNDLLEKLQSCSEKGIIFKSIKQIKKKSQSIQEAVQFFDYFLPVDQSDIALSEVAEKILTSETLFVETFSKKKKMNITKDIRGKIANVQVKYLDVEESIISVIDEVSPCRNKEGLLFTLNVESGVSIKPKELVMIAERFGATVYKPIKTASVTR